jgi:hypothetical protein
MPVTVYKSTDASAPVLNGLAGSLITVLDAILVNGYGVKAAAGWTKPFTGTNKAAYRANSGVRPYYRFDDAAGGTLALGKEAFLRGYEVMTTVDAGTGLFPTATQLAAGLFLRKSRTLDATARKWVCVADDRTAYMFIYSDDYPGYASFMIGEIFSVMPGITDGFRSAVIGRNIQEAGGTGMPLASAGNENLDLLSAVTTTVPGHFLARSFNQNGPQATPFGKHGNSAHSVSTLNGFLNYPNPSDAAVYLSQVWVQEPYTTPIIRGRMRGFWHFLHPVASQINDGDTWSGTGPLAGKTFMAIKPTAAGTGMFVMETSNTWETN